MNKDAHSLNELYTLLSEKKKVNPFAVCTKSVGRKDKKKYKKCVTDVEKTSEEEETPASEDNQEPVSETNAFLNRLAARLLSDNAGGYTSDDVNKLKEIARNF